ncbi:MAG: Ni/Fe-hydrogenase cytochrome b subunit [Planctomycetes bacterium]|nr:Ni/Fe-hydrogenase cytochrome b subunit [Planctomycetota bacterium]
MTRAESRPRYFTPGVWVVAAFAAIGAVAWIYRMLFGLGAATNLNNAYPWGIWIGIDVATGVALAAGGFTTAFLAHILHREQYHPLVRPALLTAMLGYTFVALGVMTDLGRFWAMWHVMLPTMWQPNSVLFEVAICVMCYLSVLYIEFLPAVCERFVGRVNLPGPARVLNRHVDRALRFADATLGRFMTIFIILGIMLSCMHQSSLGTLMVITEGKLNAFWHTPALPALFLLSAFAVGYPMVIFESIIAHRSFGLRGESDLLSRLARFIPFTLGVYFTAKITDLAVRGQLPHLLDRGTYSRLLLSELLVGVVFPFIIFASRPLRSRTAWLFVGSACVIAGVVLNRLNVFLFAYSPLDRSAVYSPSLSEVAVTIGAVAMTVLIYRGIAINLPVIEQLEPPHAPHRASVPREVSVAIQNPVTSMPPTAHVEWCGPSVTATATTQTWSYT